MVVLRLLDCSIDGKPQMFGSCFFGIHSSYHLSSVSNSLFGVESTILASHALTDNFGVFVDENLGPVGSGVRATLSSLGDASSLRKCFS